MILTTKSFEIFCGTGGVGKTTLATARALNLAQSGLRVLLVTIDPAKRLKDLLKLEASAIGEAKTKACAIVTVLVRSPLPVIVRVIESMVMAVKAAPINRRDFK